MRALLQRTLRRIVGPGVADSILGDCAEARASVWRLFALIVEVAVERVREQWQEHWRSPWRAPASVADMRYAARSLIRAPWYTSTVIGVMALSMSLAITVFAVVDGVLFKALPYPRPHELMVVDAKWTSREWSTSFRSNALSRSDVAAWRDTVPDAAFTLFNQSGETYFDDGPGVSEAMVDEQFFNVLGIQPRIGGFQSSDFDRFAGAPRPTVISDQLWRARFNADPQVVGRVVRPFAGNNTFRIAGVLPPEFEFPEPNAQFTPSVIFPIYRVPSPATDRNHSYQAIVRIPSGRPANDVLARLQTATEQLRDRFIGERDGGRSLGPFDMVRLQSVDQGMRSASQYTFRLVLAAACLLLILAWVNVTSLAIARGQDRAAELRMRRALGAGSADLVRLLAAESTVIVLMSAGLAIALAQLLIDMCKWLLPANVLLLRPLAMDWRVGAFVTLVSIAAVVATTIWPARAALRGLGSRHRREGSVSVTRSLRLGVISVQVALALVMTLSGAILLATLARVWSEDPGYVSDGLLNVSVETRSKPDWTTTQKMIEDLQHIDGAAAAGGVSWPLFDKLVQANPFVAADTGVRLRAAQAYGVTGGFFEAAQLKLKAGRWMTADEIAQSARVAVITEGAARSYWKDESPVGRELVRSNGTYTVVGVTADARFSALDREPSGNVFYPISIGDFPFPNSIVIRTHAGKSVSEERLHALMAAAYPDVRVTSSEAMSTSLSRTIRQRQFRAALFSSFAAAGSAIAAVGVLGLAVMITGRRTREMGIRMALGATPSAITRLVARGELTAIISGLAVGSVCAYWIVELLRSYTYKTDVHSPAIWFIATLSLFVAAAIGALIPALRVSRIDPVRALRQE